MTAHPSPTPQPEPLPDPRSESGPETAPESRPAPAAEPKRDGRSPAKGDGRQRGLRPGPRLQIHAHGEPSEGRLFSRDLSWLEFNRRVLAQAADARLPLLERVKFLAIFTSNLDEFFMKRVGLTKRQVHAAVQTPLPSGHLPRELLADIRGLVWVLQMEQARVYESEIMPALAEAGIRIVRYQDLGTRERAALDEHFRASIFPALTPLAVDLGHRFPFISNLSDNLGILACLPRSAARPAPATPEESDTAKFARVKIPGSLRKFIPVSPRPGAKPDCFVALPDLIRNNLDDLFPGVKVEEQVHFRVTRSAGIQRDEHMSGTERESLLVSVEAELKQRKFARAVRLEIEPDPSPVLLRQLIDKLHLDRQDVYERSGPMDYSALLELADLERPDLKLKPWRPVVPRRLKTEAHSDRGGMFAAIRRQDLLVHHPYESFTASVERFIAQAASDPDVLTIKQTLYRTAADSPFIESLIRAAESGKQVACLVELRARFDEGRNVRFARQLEKAGVHVAYGVLGLKTHCKTSLVVRQEKSGLRCYAHIGTGNYHPKTAQLYTDLGLFTCDPGITGDVVNLFNALTGLAPTQTYEHLLVAPFTMRARFIEMIDREIESARRGLPARISAKLNSLEDREITDKLYEASRAGVQVHLIVRGFCCLRPGVPGLSENIRVISIVGRFLEHSRIFHFAAGHDDPVDGDWYMGSADWMYRNLNTRVEAVVPVRDQDARRRLQRLFEVSWLDQRNAWELGPSGAYAQRFPAADAPPDSPQALGTFDTLQRAALEENA